MQKNKLNLSIQIQLGHGMKYEMTDESGLTLDALHPTKAYCKRAGLWGIEVCSSLFIFISLDRAQVLIARQQ